MASRRATSSSGGATVADVSGPRRAAEGIETDRVYVLADFMLLAKLQRSGWTSLKLAGMPHYRSGRRTYVYGGDFLAFLREQAARNDSEME